MTYIITQKLHAYPIGEKKLYFHGPVILQRQILYICTIYTVQLQMGIKYFFYHFTYFGWISGFYTINILVEMTLKANCAVF